MYNQKHRYVFSLGNEENIHYVLLSSQSGLLHYLMLIHEIYFEEENVKIGVEVTIFPFEQIEWGLWWSG